MQIRRAKPEDCETIYQFIVELEKTNLDEIIFKEYYAENTVDKDKIYLVATLENEAVIGFVSCHGQKLLHHAAKVFEIQELFVKKEFRSAGVGLSLLQKVETILIENGYHFFEVTANISRSKTHLFYTNCGFVYTHKKFTKIL